MLNGVTITTQEVLDKQRYLRAFLQGKLGDSNLREGSFFNDIVVKPAAYLAVLMEKEAQRVVNSLDVNKISEVEDRASSQVLDELASNFFIERKSGTTSQGVLTIVVSQQSGFVIQPNTIFTKVAGVEFFYAGAGGSDQPLVVSQDDLLEELDANGEPTNYYYYEIAVEGTVSFVGSNLAPGDFESMNPSVPNLVRVHNKSAFSAAEGEETNGAFAQRIKGALTTRGMYSKSGIEAYILDALTAAISVNTIGASSSVMKRDILSINSTEVRVLGKSNIYVNTGFYSVNENFLKTATPMAAPASIQLAADIRPTFQTSTLVSKVTTDAGVELVLLGNTLAQGRTHADPLGETEFTISYDTPSDSDNLTNTTGSIYARTSLENMQLTAGANLDPFAITVLLPKAHALAENLVQEESVAALGVDQLVYAPTVKKVSLSLRYRLREDSPGLLPESVLKADVASYISKYSSTKEELNIADLVHYIMEEYSSYILNLDLSNSSLRFTVFLPDGNRLSFRTTTSVSFSDAEPYYIFDNQEYGYQPQSGYLEGLQVSDATSCAFCLPEDVTLEEI